MIIDGHSHVTFPLEEHIQAMNQAGVDKTLLFSTTFHIEEAKNIVEIKEKFQFLNSLLAGEKSLMIMARKQSVEELVLAIEKYPDRYLGFGAVPPGLNLNDTTEYIEENICKNHLLGIGEFTLGMGQAPLLEHIFNASGQLGNLPVWIHAFFPYSLEDIKETVILAKKHPQIPVILGHLGGSNWMETMELAKENSNVYLDTSAYYSTFVLKTIINEIPEKCIFGVDRPFGDLSLGLDALRKLAQDKSVFQQIAGDNISQLLKL